MDDVDKFFFCVEDSVSLFFFGGIGFYFIVLYRYIK